MTKEMQAEKMKAEKMKAEKMQAEKNINKDNLSAEGTRTRKIGGVLLFLSLPVSLFLLPFPIYSLSFDEVIATIEETYEMQSIQREIQRLEAEKRAASSPEDIRAALNPQTTIFSVVDESFAEETSLTGAASLSLPLSLSPAERDAVQTWQNSIAQAETRATETYVNTYIKLFELYQGLWLLQEEEAVLKLEVGAAEVYVELIRERFKVGTVPLASLNLAEETLTERQEDLIGNRLEQRLTWFELSRFTGITAAASGGAPEIPGAGNSPEEASVNQAELPRLKAVDFRVRQRIEDLLTPPEMEGWIVENHPALLRERIGIAQLRQNIDRLLKPDYDLSVKSFLNYRDHSFSLTYNLADPEVSAGYNFPIFSAGEIPSGSGSSVETWNTGIGVNLSIGSNRHDRLRAEAQGILLEEEQARLEYLTQQSLLNLRSAYQQLLKSLELMAQAERSLERSRDTRNIVEAKRELDQAPRHEVLESTAGEARAAWKVQESRVTAEKAYLNLLKESALFEEKL
jgi:outer membrane protein TolC